MTRWSSCTAPHRPAARRERPRVVVLCDVSSSMRPSTPLFLALVHSLTRRVRRVEAAVFNVELAMVTDVFRRATLGQSLAWLEQQQVTIAGGTRIGHCLHGFLEAVDRRGGLRQDTVALVLGDGWEVGEPGLLADRMRRPHARTGRVVWCDPHAALTGYHPQVQGLQVALAHVEDYVDFSSPASLSDLVLRLEGGARGRGHRVPVTAAQPRRSPIHALPERIVS